MSPEDAVLIDIARAARDNLDFVTPLLPPPPDTRA